MELTEIAQRIKTLRAEDDEPENAVRLLAAKVGQLAESAIHGEKMDEGDVSQDQLDEHRRDLFAGLLLSTMEYAFEHDLDVELAVEERLEHMEERHEKSQAVREAVENGDAAALAEALEADQNEVPTGLFDDDDSESPAFQ